MSMHLLQQQLRMEADSSKQGALPEIDLVEGQNRPVLVKSNAELERGTGAGGGQCCNFTVELQMFANHTAKMKTS